MFKKYFFPIVVLSLITIIVFYNLPNTFYQQDEWQSLGHNLALGIKIFANTSPLQLLFGELRPLSGLMYLIFLGFFKFTVVPIMIFAIFFQILNSSLVFYLVERITKKRVVAFVASIFLIVNSVSHQAVTWAAAVGTLPAATLILIAIIMYLKYLEKGNRKYLAVSIISTIFSLYFKGIGLSLFILLPLMTFIYKDKSVNKKNVKEVFFANLPLIIFGFFILFFRFGQIFFRTEKVAGFALGAGNNSFLQTVILHLFLYPLTALFQIFVPPLDLYSITPIITKMQYKFLVGSPLTDLVAQSIVADMISIVGAVIILGFLGFMIHKYKNKIMTKNILFVLLFFFLSFLPYIVLDRGSSYLESRYFYVGAIGAGILFGYAVYFLVNINKYIKWITIFLVFLFLFHHASIVMRDINYQVNLGNERKAVLNGIKSIKPKLDDKTIFYVTGDKEYYGPITNPFQNGLGYVLEVWYYDSGKIPKSFLSENFLWDLGSEGYKEKGNYGFGYFQDIDKMANVMEKNKLSINTVHAFFINSKENKVLNIDQEVKGRLATISAILK
jgi:hypothetical protein